MLLRINNWVWIRLTRVLFSFECNTRVRPNILQLEDFRAAKLERGGKNAYFSFSEIFVLKRNIPLYKLMHYTNSDICKKIHYVKYNYSVFLWLILFKLYKLNNNPSFWTSQVGLITDWGRSERRVVTKVVSELWFTQSSVYDV